DSCGSACIVAPRAAARVRCRVLAFGIAGVRSRNGAGVAKPVNAETWTNLDSATMTDHVLSYLRGLRVADFATPRKAGERDALRLFTCHPQNERLRPLYEVLERE